MKLFKHLFSIFILFYLFLITPAQKTPISFGEIDLADVEMIDYEPDKSADAVILCEYGIAEIVFTNGLQLEYDYHVRIKIINSNGFEYANVEIPYSGNDVLTSLQASTYNIENDVIVITPVGKKDFFVDKITSRYRMMRFALPNIRVGSVIEYKYRLKTNAIFGLVPWQFQKAIPVRYSNFTSVIPSYFNYKETILGDIDNRISITYDRKNVYLGGFSTIAMIKNYSANLIPAYKYEPFSTGSDDYVTQLSYELGGVNFPGSSYTEITPTYESLSKKLLEREDFGKALLKTKFLKKVTENVTSGITDETDKLIAIHHYVSTLFIWNGTNDYTLSAPLSKSFNQERGNSADINFIYIAMLRHAGISAEPVILSTRSSGMLNPFYVVMQKLNYVVVRVKTDGKEFLSDATDPLRPYDLLPFECLNRTGRLISVKSGWIDLKNNEKTVTVTNLNLKLDSTGEISGTYNAQYKGYDAFAIRKYIKLEGVNGYKDDVRYLLSNWEISDHMVENDDSIRLPVIEKFTLKSTNEAQLIPSKIILNPFMMTLINENPFYYHEERKEPVDFGNPVEKTFIISFSIPENYEVEEFPDNLNLALPENGGRFLYGFSGFSNFFSVQCRIIITKTFFEPKEYEILRELYSRIIQKQSEHIVLRKKT